MSTSSTSKTLICINTCHQDAASLEELRATDWFNFVNSSSEYEVIIVLADPNVGTSFTYEDKLIIKTEEAYDNLCMKTFYMIEYFLTVTSFDFILKLDSKIIEGRHNNTSHLFSFENFLDNFYKNSFEQDYGGACGIIGTNPTLLRSWASSKNLTIMPELLLTELGIEEFPMKYWAGSSYSLSRKFAQKVY